jgi:uncharacterized membrane protein YhaH (DUF805 family)
VAPDTAVAAPVAPPVLAATPAPGWYPDPANAAALRYWDGAQWTAHQAAGAGAGAGAGAYPSRSFGFGESVRRAFSKWSDYSGRATVGEFWWFYLFTALVTVGIYLLAVIAAVILLPSNRSGSGSSSSGGGAIVVIVLTLAFLVAAIALFVVYLSLAVRRLHDTDKSGWWYLIAFVPFGGLILLIFWIQAGTPGPNQYGPPST